MAYIFVRVKTTVAYTWPGEKNKPSSRNLLKDWEQKPSFILPTNRNPFISSQNTVQKGIINKNFSFLWHIFVTSGNSTLQSCLTFPTQKISPEGTPLSTQVANAQLYAQEIGHQALQGGKQKSDQTLKKICPVKMLTLEVGLPPW